MNNASLVGDWAETRSFVVLSTLSSISLYVRYVKSFYRIISEGRIIVDSTPKSAPIQSTEISEGNEFRVFFSFAHLRILSSLNERKRIVSHVFDMFKWAKSTTFLELVCERRKYVWNL